MFCVHYNHQYLSTNLQEFLEKVPKNVVKLFQGGTKSQTRKRITKVYCDIINNSYAMTEVEYKKIKFFCVPLNKYLNKYVWGQHNMNLSSNDVLEKIMKEAKVITPNSDKIWNFAGKMKQKQQDKFQILFKKILPRWQEFNSYVI